VNEEARPYKSIPVENLLVDLTNPRHDPAANQQLALATIARDQGPKLVRLAESILERGLNRTELPIVTPAGQGEQYTVLEGNRRIAALKLLSIRSLSALIGLPHSLASQYARLHDRATSLPAAVDCVVMSREDAEHWIRIRHTGDNGGIGVIPWDGKAKHRFRGLSTSPALQAIDLVVQAGYLDDAATSKIAITNIERVLNTPEARRLIGVDVKKRQLILLPPEDKALGRLALIVADVLSRAIKVTDLDSKVQRVAYARDIAHRELPKSPGDGTPRGGTSSTESTRSPAKQARRVPTERDTLIPKQLKLEIKKPRINSIYFELMALPLQRFVNSGAVMLRVFVEMSLDDYAHRNSIPLTVRLKRPTLAGEKTVTKDMSLREKMRTVADHMEKTGVCDKSPLLGIRTIANNKYHVLSVDGWNAYVHNSSYHPEAAELKHTWDNIQTFVELLWAKS